MTKVDKSECLRIEDCTLGLKVKLRCPDPEYDIGKANPAIGTRWECEGSITEVLYDAVYVRWKTGYENCYKDFELVKADELNYGIYKSIWN